MSGQGTRVYAAWQQIRQGYAGEVREQVGEDKHTERQSRKGRIGRGKTSIEGHKGRGIGGETCKGNAVQDDPSAWTDECIHREQGRRGCGTRNPDLCGSAAAARSSRKAASSRERLISAFPRLQHRANEGGGDVTWCKMPCFALGGERERRLSFKLEDRREGGKKGGKSICTNLGRHWARVSCCQRNGRE